MQLLMSLTSPFARKVRGVAIEKDLAGRIELVAMDPFADPATLIAVNPLGRVPTLLRDDGEPLYDSAVICAFLDAHPDGRGPSLYPVSGPERWRVLRAEAFADGALDLAFGLTLESRKPEAERSPTTAARWRAQLLRAIDAAEGEIAALPGRLTMGHLAIACLLGYLDLRHRDLAWRDGRAALAGWHAEIMRRPSLAETVPPQ
jgi:glutathione S-transferase